MDIVFNVLGMPFNGATLAKESLGGSETSCIYLARGLAARGHNVVVFSNMRGPDEEGVYDGVQYCWAGPTTNEAPLGDRFEFYARNTPHDVLIAQRHPLAFQAQYASKVNLWQLHDLALQRYHGAVWPKMWNVDRVLAVSEWHKKQICDVYSFAESIVSVVPNGVDLSLYETDEDVSFPQVPEGKFLLLYQSRPERGLEHLVREGGIMERLLTQAPNAHLLIVGYDNTTREMADYYAYLYARADMLPNVTRLGHLDKRTLAALQKRCDLMVYPSEFEETYCISAVEAMAAGLPFFGSEVGALPETCRDAGAVLIPLRDGRADEDLFVSYIQERYDFVESGNRMRDGTVSEDHYERHQLAAAKARTWAKAVDTLEATITSCFAAAKCSPTAVLRHALDTSDIAFARWYIERQKANDAAPTRSTLWRNMVEREMPLYDFTKSPEAYVAHYRLHGDAYYNGPWQNQRREDVTHQNRFVGTVQLLDAAIADLTKDDPNRSLRIMDYGCAHGHYLVRLAERYPQHSFYGVDVSARAVKEANTWISELGLTNARVDLATDPFKALQHWQTNLTLDIVICAECLEHVPEPVSLLDHLRSRLADDGFILTTTPYGGWEKIGYYREQTGREHLHHFEREDFTELYANALNYDFRFAANGTDERGFLIGSWLCLVRPGKGEFRPIDYDRKLRQLAPRQTISACLIVKDGERTIGKCLDSIAPWVDEIVVGVDVNTSDGTVRVLDDFREKHPTWPPLKIIEVGPATDVSVGFAGARNATVAKASGDWILWQDADEEMVRASGMHALLRQSMHNAFNVAQVHYAAEPPAVVETDFPTRIFRNFKGITFYGLVHEHPEVECGKAIPHSFVTHRFKVLHNGYITEEVRRGRFIRNLPLLVRDCEERPQRILNNYLRVRDIAQSINFELQQTGGQPLPHHPVQAKGGVELWEKLLDEQPHPRLLVQSLQYYSALVAMSGSGIDVGFKFGAGKGGPIDLSHCADIRGHFTSTSVLQKFMGVLINDQTKPLESRYW